MMMMIIIIIIIIIIIGLAPRAVLLALGVDKAAIAHKKPHATTLTHTSGTGERTNDCIHRLIHSTQHASSLQGFEIDWDFLRCFEAFWSSWTIVNFKGSRFFEIFWVLFDSANSSLQEPLRMSQHSLALACAGLVSFFQPSAPVLIYLLDTAIYDRHSSTYQMVSLSFMSHSGHANSQKMTHHITPSHEHVKPHWSIFFEKVSCYH